MTLIQLLKIQWEWLGLKAPWFSWIAAVGLLIYPVYYLIKLYIHFRRESQLYTSIIKELEAIQTHHQVRPGQGLTDAAFDAVAQVFEKNPSFFATWNSFNAQIVRHKNKDGGDQFWATDSADSAFSESALIDAQLNKGMFVSIPGIVTGMGLLFTFLAILIALLM